MLAVNDVGKPCAGEPHARIDGRELETEHTTDHGDGEEPPNGKPSGHTAPTPTAGRSHRASSRPSNLAPPVAERSACDHHERVKLLVHGRLLRSTRLTRSFG
jgi:hypothetical protein